MIVSKFGHAFEEFKVGDSFQHALSKTIFESDNNLFSLLTMNHHPLHTNIEYAKNSQQKQIVVVGTLVFSLVVGITVPEISGQAIANLGYEEVKHLGPVYVNDTIYAKSKILEVEECSHPNKGRVKVKTFAYNQKDELVLELTRTILLKR